MKTPAKVLRVLSLISLILPAVLAISAHGQAIDSLNSISFTATSAAGGSSIEGRVTLSRPATEDIEVSLAADPVTAAKVPSSVTIKAGETSATFTVTTILSQTAIGGDDTVVSIYANYGMTKHADLTVLAPVSFDRMIDKVIAREHSFIDNVKQYRPLAETYIQNMQEGKEHNVRPVADTYFLGRLDFKESTNEEVFQKNKPGGMHHFFSPLEMLEKNTFTRHYVPNGFATMAIVDRDFQKANYYFTFVRQEFLGEVRCIVVDVQPKEKAHQGSFVGRIWVEDHDFNIVRFNGTYSNKSNYDSYFHFDSWRMNTLPGIWLPSYIYSEETVRKHDLPPFIQPRFKAQTRFWDYDEVHIKHESEFTDVRVDMAQDHEAAFRAQATPLEAQRNWERLAEDNAIDHLQKIGLIAPLGPVDRVLQIVVDNLSITNNLEIIPDVRCRVLLTTPLESFTIGHTIVISRGLIDVLPDEGALAMVLSHELAHIVLNHRIDTKFAFNDRFFFSEPVTFQRMDFGRNALDEQAADKKAIELLNNSPYKDKLASAGLFLRQIQDRAQVLPNLIRPHFGNPLGNKDTTRLAPVATVSPKLEDNVDQVSALSLGARVNLNPWNNQIEMMSAKHVTLLSPADKMPLEVTPFFPYLTRMFTKPPDFSQSATVVGVNR
ncbi:MAG: M48 family metalloprotease [Candidatus Sulfotelmatobacter sp.]